jgi:hypothetical protein
VAFFYYVIIILLGICEVILCYGIGDRPLNMSLLHVKCLVVSNESGVLGLILYSDIDLGRKMDISVIIYCHVYVCTYRWCLDW